jgi:hypothetical protein
MTDAIFQCFGLGCFDFVFVVCVVCCGLCFGVPLVTRAAIAIEISFATML